MSMRALCILVLRYRPQGRAVTDGFLPVWASLTYPGRLRCMPSPEAPLAGSCACGAVQFQVTADFTTAGHCHCTRCQRRAGTPWSHERDAADAARLDDARRCVGSLSRLATRGRAAEGVLLDLRRARVVGRAGRPDGVVGVRFGALHGDPGIEPQWRQWLSSAQDWVRDPGRRPAALRAEAPDRLNPDQLSSVAVHQQLAWYIGGPVLGLCVVALRWLLNERLGATGAWADAVERVVARSASAPRLAADRPDLRRRRVRARSARPRRLRLADGHVHGRRAW